MFLLSELVSITWATRLCIGRSKVILHRSCQVPVHIHSDHPEAHDHGLLNSSQVVLSMVTLHTGKYKRALAVRTRWRSICRAKMQCGCCKEAWHVTSCMPCQQHSQQPASLTPKAENSKQSLHARQTECVRHLQLQLLRQASKFVAKMSDQQCKLHTAYNCSLAAMHVRCL